MAVGRFDFVSGDAFRESLASDYEELERCLEARAYKAVHVLAGSIVEAILVDYLVASGYNKKDPLKLELAQAIDECKSAGIVSQRIVDLSNVIRDYRNLIHPGRVIRLEESVDSSGAVIAKSLVEIVIKEVSKKKAKEYGYTAEQILTKLESDPRNDPVIRHLTSEIAPTELERLMLKVLPEQFLDAGFDTGDDQQMEIRRAVRLCYRTAFEIADPDTKAKAVKKVIKTIKEGSELQVTNCESLFISGLEPLPGARGDR